MKIEGSVKSSKCEKPEKPLKLVNFEESWAKSQAKDK